METKNYMFKLGHKLYSMISNWSQLEIKFMLCYGFLKERQKMFFHDERMLSAKTIGQYCGFDSQTAYSFPSKIIPRLSSRTFLFRGKTAPCFNSVDYTKRMFDVEFSTEAFSWLFLEDDGDSYVDVDIRSLQYLGNTGFSLSLYLRLLFGKSSSVILSKDEAIKLFFADEISCRNSASVQHQLLKKAVRNINILSELSIALTPVKSASRITAWRFDLKKLATDIDNTDDWYVENFPSLLKYVKEADLGYFSDKVVRIVAFFSKDYMMFCRLIDCLKEWMLPWEIHKSVDVKTEKYILILLLTSLRGNSFTWYTHPKILSVLNYGIINNKIDIDDIVDVIKQANDYYSLRHALKLDIKK